MSRIISTQTVTVKEGRKNYKKFFYTGTVVVVVVDGVSLSLNPRDMAVFSKSVYKH